MTDREKAIVMAYTGKCMLTGDKFQIFHKYVEDIMGRPVYTHEMAIKAVDDEIKEKSKADFIALCADESSSEKVGQWEYKQYDIAFPEIGNYHCSSCNAVGKNGDNYCSVCGAKMQEVKE